MLAGLRTLGVSSLLKIANKILVAFLEGLAIFLLDQLSKNLFTANSVEHFKNTAVTHSTARLDLE